MLAAFTELKNAEKVKNYLIQKKLMHLDYNPIRELDYLYFPITKKAKVPKAKVVNTKFKFPLKQRKQTIKSLLQKKLTQKQLTLLPRSQEIVGSIMILEVPKELEPKEKLIADAYIKLNKNITTVVKKSKIHSGIFRTRKVKILAGKKSKETIHKESGVQLKLHLEKTYFSARSGNERLRIAKQVKKGEKVLVMFSGAAPFPLVIGKHSEAKEIFGVEMNPLAHRFAVDNVILNKLEGKVKIVEGDVRMILPKLRKKFDRIAMPLPKTGEEFLPVALSKSKKGTIIHLYSFLSDMEIRAYTKMIKEISKNKIKVLRKVKCGQFSPSVHRVCFDLKVV